MAQLINSLPPPPHMTPTYLTLLYNDIRSRLLRCAENVYLCVRLAAVLPRPAEISSHVIVVEFRLRRAVSIITSIADVMMCSSRIAGLLLLRMAH